MADELLSYQEVEELLETIVTNKKLKQLSSYTEPKFLLLRHPNSQDVLFSRFIRDKALLEARAEGLPSREELEARCKLSPEDQDKVTSLEEKIAAQNRLLQITKVEGRRKPIKENIEKLKNEVSQIRSKGRELIYLSAEAKAEEEAILYLAFASAYSIFGDRYWETFQDFEEERDLFFRNNLIDAFSEFNRGVALKTIRFLARHGLWRLRYSAALKVGGKLFTNELSDLTTDQMSLLYWSDYYQMVYEMLPDDRPDDDVIENDEALDAHMEMIGKRRKEERNEAKAKRRGGGKLSAWDRGEELIITAAHPEYMNMQYSEERIKADPNSSEVEVIAPNSRRAQNRAAARRNRGR